MSLRARDVADALLCDHSSMGRSRSLLAAAVLVAASIGLTGCAVPIPDEALARAWRSDQGPEGQRAVLVLDSDDSFRACGVPSVLQTWLGATVDWNRRVDVNGRWSRADDGHLDFDAENPDRLGTPRHVAFSSRLDVGEDFGGVSLFNYLGDPDSNDRFSFRPAASATCSPTF
jgi:hypothetical protein